MDLGDEATPWEQVSDFHNFWYFFRSLRDFPHPDEEDIPPNATKDERRLIECHNAKLREKRKKEEDLRLAEFVDLAYLLDPRVLRKEQEDRIEKERKKMEIEEAERM